jgi:hypothetical protein
MRRYAFHTTSAFTTVTPGRERRKNEAPIARVGGAHPQDLWTTGRLEAALAAGLTPVVLSSRAKFFEHDAWWRELVQPEHIHLDTPISATGTYYTVVWSELLSRVYDITWPMERALFPPGSEYHREGHRDSTPQLMFWSGALKQINKTQLALQESTP